MKKTMVLMILLLCVGLVSADYTYTCDGTTIIEERDGVDQGWIAFCPDGSICDDNDGGFTFSSKQQMVFIRDFFCIPTGCVENSECSGSEPFCHLPSGNCVECLNDNACPDDFTCDEDNLFEPRHMSCIQGSECSDNDDCSDGNQCSLDVCDAGFCQHECTDLDGLGCGTNKICESCACLDLVDPCAGKNCADNDPCSQDYCQGGVCVHELIEGCDESCVSDSDCELPPRCYGADMKCEDGRCDVVGSCSACPAYMELVDGECNYSSSFFSGPGISAFVSDFFLELIVGIVGISGLVLLIIYLKKRKGDV